MAIQTVGIIGAGTMGNGIAQACAVSGIDVVMVDISEAAVQKGLATVAGSLDRLIKKEKISEADKSAALARIKTSTSYDDLKSAQLVIEAATENYELKVKILKQLDTLLAQDVIVATNTSSISITQLAAATQRADKFIGMHFFNPVPMMALVEIIRGLQKLGCNQPIGPLALADMIGLDVCLAVMEVYLKEFGDSKYRPCFLLREMVAAGRLGRKTGQGVYTY